jgi:hypothetical protein
LVPGTQTPPATTINAALRQPVVATTTSAPRAARLVSVVGEERFPLIPVAGLDGFFHVEGPVHFQDRYWVAANEAETRNAVVLSSPDGDRWEVESQLLGGEMAIVEDLTVFRGNLVVVGTSSQSISTTLDVTELPMAWASLDGRAWTSNVLDAETQVAYSEMKAVAGPNVLLVTSYLSASYSDQLLSVVPDGYVPAILDGRLSAWWTREGDTLVVDVVAPPGIRLFSAETEVTGPQLDWGNRLWRTTDGLEWNRHDLTELSMLNPPGNIVWLDDEGFVASSMYSGMLTSRDGITWQPSSLPVGSYQPWADGVVIYTGQGVTFATNGERQPIRLPSELQGQTGGPWIMPGPDHILAATTEYGDQDSPTVISVGNLELDAIGELLTIRQGGSEPILVSLTYTRADPPQATYDPATDSVLLDIPDRAEPISLPLEVLGEFWNYSPSYRTELFQTEDGLVWSRSENAFLSSAVTLLGPVDGGFLVGIGGDRGNSEPITAYRTGPIR